MEQGFRAPYTIAPLDELSVVRRSDWQTETVRRCEAGSNVEADHRICSGVLSVSRIGGALPLPAHLNGSCLAPAFTTEYVALQQAMQCHVSVQLSGRPKLSATCTASSQALRKWSW